MPEVESKLNPEFPNGRTVISFRISPEKHYQNARLTITLIPMDLPNLAPIVHAITIEHECATTDAYGVTSVSWITVATLSKIEDFLRYLNLAQVADIQTGQFPSPSLLTEHAEAITDPFKED